MEIVLETKVPEPQALVTLISTHTLSPSFRVLVVKVLPVETTGVPFT
jgi:hypothetical protein